MRKLFLLFLYVMSSFTAFAQDAEKRVFEFAAITEDTKWKQMSVHERIQALQIPEDLIHDIPTSELLETCLGFPYLIDVLFSDDLQQGFKELTVEFNGFRELLLRKDLTEVVLSKNKNLTNEITKTNDNLYDKGLFSIKWLVFEMLLTQDSFLSSLNDDAKALLLSSCKENMKIKNGNPSVFSSLNSIPSYLLFVKQIMDGDAFKQMKEEEKDLMIRFVKRPVGIPDSLIPLILDHINSNVISL